MRKNLIDAAKFAQTPKLKIPVCKPFLWGNEIKYVNEALQTGWISSQGSFIDKFENNFSSFCQSKYGVAVSNGTNALHLALHVLGLKEGDEIIMPDFTMMAPVFAVIQMRCVPIFIDVDDTWNIDVTRIEDRISSKTRAILVVHNYGHPANLVAISELCRKHHLLLIEDCSEALGATVNEKLIGNWGDVACYSFYANKIITTGEGGMITTNSKEIFETTKSKRNMSFGKTDQTRFEHPSIGFNYRMTNIQAAIGVGQVEFIDKAIERKIEIAQKYKTQLRGITGLILPPEEDWAKNVYWVFGIIVTKDFGCSKDFLQSALKLNGIESRNFFTPAHQQPFLKDLQIIGSFPNSTFMCENGLYLPSFMDLSDSEIEYICMIIHRVHDEMR